MSITATSLEAPIWPGGMARFADGILGVTTGDGIRVADRRSRTLACRAWPDRVRTSRRVEPEHEAALRELVDAAMKSKRAA